MNYHRRIRFYPGPEAIKLADEIMCERYGLPYKHRRPYEEGKPPSDEQLIFQYLCWLLGAEPELIAEVVGRSVGGLKVTLHHARREEYSEHKLFHEAERACLWHLGKPYREEDEDTA